MPPQNEDWFVSFVRVSLPIVTMICLVGVVWLTSVIRRSRQFQDTALNREAASAAREERVVELLTQSVENQKQIIRLLEKSANRSGLSG